MTCGAHAHQGPRMQPNAHALVPTVHRAGGTLMGLRGEGRAVGTCSLHSTSSSQVSPAFGLQLRPQQPYRGVRRVSHVYIISPHNGGPRRSRLERVTRVELNTTYAEAPTRAHLEACTSSAQDPQHPPVPSRVCVLEG